MPRTKVFARAFGLSMVMVSLLLAVSLPVHGSAASADKAVSQPSMGASGPGRVDCAQAPQASDVPIFALPEGGACKADPTPVTLPDWVPVAGRTCRCSCGYPCKTDADCGGGIGSCRGGITCC